MKFVKSKSPFHLADTEKHATTLDKVELLARLHPEVESGKVPSTSIAFSALANKWKDNLHEATIDEIVQLTSVTVKSLNRDLNEFLPGLVAEVSQRVDECTDEILGQLFTLLSLRPLKWQYPDLVALFEQEIYHRVKAKMVAPAAMALYATSMYRCGHSVKDPLFYIYLMKCDKWTTSHYTIFQYVAFCDFMSPAQTARLAEKLLKVIEPESLSRTSIVCLAQVFLYCKSLAEFMPPELFSDIGARIEDMIPFEDVDAERMGALLLFCFNHKCLTQEAITCFLEKCKIQPSWSIPNVAKLVYTLGHLKAADDERHFHILNEHGRQLELFEVASQYMDVVMLYSSLAHIGLDVPKWSEVVVRYLQGSVDLVAEKKPLGTMRLLAALSELHLLPDDLLVSFFKAFSIYSLDFPSLVVFCTACCGQLGHIPDKFWNGLSEQCTGEVVDLLPEPIRYLLLWLDILSARQHLNPLSAEVRATLEKHCNKRLREPRALDASFHKDIEAILRVGYVRHCVELEDGMTAHLALLVDESGVPQSWSIGGGLDGNVSPDYLKLQSLYPVVIRFVSSDECVMLKYGGVPDGDSASNQLQPSEEDRCCEFAWRRSIQTELMCFEAAGWIPVALSSGEWWLAEDKAALLRNALREQTQANLQAHVWWLAWIFWFFNSITSSIH